MDVGLARSPRLDVAGLSANEQLAALHARHYVPLVRLAVALVDHEESAEEIVQEAFLRMLRGWTRLRDPRTAEAYLRRAVINGARDQLRARRVRRAAALPVQDVEPSAEHRVVLAEQDRLLLAAVHQLPRRQREVLVLRFFAELSERETAETLGMAVGTVKSTTHRGLSVLRGVLAQAGHGTEEAP